LAHSRSGSRTPDAADRPGRRSLHPCIYEGSGRGPCRRSLGARDLPWARSSAGARTHHCCGGSGAVCRGLCNAAQVSERTLRNVFHESFGVGPIRYLRLRQLHRVRTRLLDADPDCDSVTKVARLRCLGLEPAGSRIPRALRRTPGADLAHSSLTTSSSFRALSRAYSSVVFHATRGARKAGILAPLIHPAP
jgi:AraC-like DNA-binding protein